MFLRAIFDPETKKKPVATNNIRAFLGLTTSSSVTAVSEATTSAQAKDKGMCQLAHYQPSEFC